MLAFYTTNCPKCLLLEKLLKESSREYETIDLRKDREALDALLERGFGSAPLLGLEDGRIIAFREALAYLKEGSDGR